MDIMNEALHFNRMQALHQTSPCIDLHDPPEILDLSIPFAAAPPLLFNIPTHNDRMVDLYVDDYINVCLDKTRDGVHEATTYFNVITNVFEIFYSNTVSFILNELKRKVALLLRKLQGEGIPDEVKKVLG